MVNLVRHDLEFILKQIKIAEANSTAHSGDSAKKLTEIRVDADGNVVAEGGTLAVPTPLSPYGLRTVDGGYNNLVDGRNEWGGSDTPFEHVTDPYWRNEQDDQIVFGTPQNSVTMTNNNYGTGGSVVDADPRIISNLIVDQSLDNPAAIYTALSYAGVTGQALLTTTQAIRAAKDALDTAIENAEAAGSDIPDLQQALAAAQAEASSAQAIADAAQLEAAADQAAYDAAVVVAQAAEAEADQALDTLTAFLIDGIVPDELQEGYAAALADFLAKQAVFGEAEATATTLGNEAEASAATAQSAAVTAAAAAAIVVVAQQELDDALAANGDADAAVIAAKANLQDLLDDNGVVVENGSVVLPNVSPDEGLSAPYNSWFTLFGQFFDHGLDLVPKGGNGSIYIPLQPDDPLYNPDSPHTNFMVLTRAPAAPDNLTTPWVDQNQTYSSHASKQLFMREYALVDGKPVATGKLLEGSKEGLATWADIKAQAREVLGIDLTDADVTNIPMFVMDAYGEFVRGPTGFPQMVVSLGADNKFGGEGADADVFVEGSRTNPISTANAVRTGHAFLDDIAHAAGPRSSTGAMLAQDADDAVGYTGGYDTRGNQTSYDNELLDAHYITGDGRGNENIGLTAVHHVFHSEHNHMVDQVKTRAIESGDVKFLNEWLRVPVSDDTVFPDPTDAEAVKAFANSLAWDGERLFQAARFTTEMQYQHLVFEEFARKVQPDVDAFVFQPSMDINPAIFAEFAHVVYRFGHSMLRETVDQTGADGVQDNMDLFEAFLNPLAFGANGLNHAEAAGAIVRGMTSQVGNEIDEFVTGVLRNQLLGIPLDLAALNIARGRDTGIPPLNEARRQFREIASGDTQLDPYTSWTDFMLNLKNPASIVNFIAAYGTHDSITGATSAEAKRDAAWKIVFGGEGAPPDRLAFLNATGSYAGGKLGGLEDVDLWVGGMAEKKMAFGGMLGSTFSFIFELQLENLQNADRFYYLSRVQGLNFLNELENNSFAKMVLNNTDLGESGYALPGDIFSTPDHVLYVDHNVQMMFGHQDPTHDDPVLGAISQLVERVDANGDGIAEYIRYNGNDHVLIQGTNGNDHIVAGGGDDSVWGRDGDDKIEAGYGVDKIHGGKGDDIITNSGTDIGEVDMLHGEEGNDVIHGGSGLALIFGNEGQDFIMAGPDGKEVFGGSGNDFILGGDGGDGLLGNEGDDWIEGGNGFDVISGDNSELNFNSTIIGHDVMFAGQNEQDFDAESGDDIMVQGESVMRNEGMFGYDWAIHKFNGEAADSDLITPIFTTDEQDILRDRFDQVEALSGWIHDDVLRGDNRGDPNAEVPPPGANGDAVETVFTNNELTQAGVNRITGLRALLGDMIAAAPTSGDLEKVIAFQSGNILIGGSGSDTIEGRGGDDVIDGDAWLNVRIGIYDASNNLIGSADAMGGAVTGVNGTSLYNGRPLHDLMLDRTLNPGQLKIIREILVSNEQGDVDTAVYSGNRDDYTVIQMDDDSVRIIDNRGIDTSTIGDRVHRVEQFKFADGTVSFRELVNVAPEITNNNGDALTVSINENSPVDATVVDINATDANVADTLVYSISAGNLSGLFAIDAATGRIFLTASPDYEALLALGQASQTLTITVSDGIATDTIDVTVNIADVPELVVTGPVTLTASAEDMVRTITLAELLANANLDGSTEGLTVSNVTVPDGKGTIISNGDGSYDYIPALNDESDVTVSFTINGGGTSVTTTATLDLLPYVDVNGDNLNNTLTGGTGQTLNRAEQFHAGGGNDSINPNGGDDIIFGGAGNDTVNSTTQAGVNRGAGNDTFVAENNDGNDTYNGGDGVDTYDLRRVTGSVTVNLADTTNGATGAAGTDSLTGIENVIGGRGNDTLLGDGAANLLRGHVGNDSISGGGGNDSLFGDAGNDTIDGGAGRDTLTGGAGADRFVFDDDDTGTGVNGRDVITDFVQGQDVIDIDGIDANLAFLSGGGDQDFAFIGNSAFTQNGQVRYRHETVNGVMHTIVEGRATGTLGAFGAPVFFEIAILGQHNLTAADFVGITNAQAAGNPVGLFAARAPSVAENVAAGTVVATLASLASEEAGAITYSLQGAQADLYEIQGNQVVLRQGAKVDFEKASAHHLTVVATTDGETHQEALTIQIEDVKGITWSSGSTRSQRVAGSNEDDVIRGGKGHDRISGHDGDDRLYGGNGHDRIDGGVGADRMWGGRGNDVFVVDDRGDRVFESRGQGFDTIKSSVSYSLSGTHVERLMLTGSDDLNGAGNGLDNHLSGNSGNNVLKGGAGHDKLFGRAGDDVLIGGSGHDRLTGGSGADTFVFQKGGGRDVVTDFRHGQDDIDVSRLNGVNSLSDLDIRQEGRDTLIQHDNSILVLKGVNASDLDSNDFIF